MTSREWLKLDLQVLFHPRKLPFTKLDVNVQLNAPSKGIVMISQTVEYALRAVAHLAAESPNSCKTQRIAEVTQVPSAYLSKVLQSLAKAKIVRSQRGIGGGVTLAAFSTW